MVNRVETRVSMTQTSKPPQYRPNYRTLTGQKGTHLFPALPGKRSPHEMDDMAWIHTSAEEYPIHSVGLHNVSLR